MKSEQRFIEFEPGEVDQSIPRRVQAQARRHSDRLALCTPTDRLTYAQLDTLANRIAHAILAETGLANEPVAVLLEHGAPLIAAILGVLKAGKICVPLDPSYPWHATASCSSTRARGSS